MGELDRERSRRASVRRVVAQLGQTRLFDGRSLFRFAVLFFAAFLLGNLTLNGLAFVSPWMPNVVPETWPIGQGHFRMPTVVYHAYLWVFDTFGYAPPGAEYFGEHLLGLPHLLVVLAYTGFFTVVLTRIDRLRKGSIYIVGVISLVLSNAIQGPYQGLVLPVAGRRGEPSHQYYHDVPSIADPVAFVGNYHHLQPDLFMHSQTHPPGAVMVYYALEGLLGHPLLISLAICVLALLAVFYVHDFARRQFDERSADFVTLVFVFLPTTQIYFLSSLDALVLFAFLGFVYHYHRATEGGRWRHRFAYACFGFAAFLLTFMAVFLVPIVVLDAFHRDGLSLAAAKRPAAAFAPVVVGLTGLWLLIGFNYPASFLIASAYESSQTGGIYVLAKPLAYALTRVEDVAEILLFLGPIVSLMAYNGGLLARTDATRYAVYAIATISMLFLAGVYRVGETARGALFLVPFVLFLVGNHAHHHRIGVAEKRQVAVALWMQSVLMQMFGFYFW